MPLVEDSNVIIWQRTKERFKSILDSTAVRSVLVGLFCLAVLIVSLIVSVWFTKNPDDAARGGAVVVAMSFYYILKNVRIIDPNRSPEVQTYIEAKIDKEHKILLSIMSITGSLAWGFLDIVAEFILMKI